MTGALEVALRRPKFPVGTWRVHGFATIDDRPAMACTATISGDGTWLAEVSTFTLAGEVELFLVSDEGGHFCGPATVESSRADTEPFHMRTFLRGAGPLLIVAPGSSPELPAEMVDAEVIDEVTS